LVTFLVIVSLLLIGIYSLYPRGPQENWSGSGSGEVVIEIPPGVNLTKVGEILEEAGVVEESYFFAIATYDRPEATKIQPGRYVMALRMGSDNAIDRLLDPANRRSLKVALPEGMRLSQSVMKLASALKVDSKLVMASIKRLEQGELTIKLPSYALGSAEGFLYPATYTFDDNVKIDQVIETIIERFNQAAVTTDLVTQAKKLGFSPREILTMASLAESESAPADFGKVVRVILNRLKEPMPLQFDSTINYALETTKLLFTKDEFNINSPYNTYRFPGLPPGPINSPGKQAIAAVLNPAAGDWLYFVSTNPNAGITKFASSYSEFLKYRAEFQNWYRENN